MTRQQKLFGFQGRVTRKDYWLYLFAMWFALVALFLLFVVVSRGAGNDGPESAGTIVFVIVAIVQMWPYLAISVKRCHDRDKSGWWMLLWIALGMIPYVGILASLWCLVELGFLDGTQGPNRFGPSPKGLGGDQISEAFT